MRITFLCVAALLPLCLAIESPKTFLRAINETNDKKLVHRSLASCPVCTVTEDADSNDSEDSTDLNGVQRFFSGVARMARQGQLRAIWDYVMTIGEALIRTPEYIHPIGLIESIVLFVDQMGLAADSIAELQVQEDAAPGTTPDLFNIFEGVIRSVQGAMAGVLDITREMTADGVGIVGDLGVIEEIQLAFMDVIVSLFNIKTGKGRRNLKEENNGIGDLVTGIPAMFDKVLLVINKLPLLAEAAGVDAGLTNVLFKLKNDSQGLYNRIQLFWTILTSNTIESIQADKATETDGVFDAFRSNAEGILANTVKFSVGVLKSTVDSAEGTALGVAVGVVETIFENVAGMQKSLFNGEVQGDSVGSSESFLVTEIVNTPVDALSTPGCERDRVFCLAETLM